MGEPDLKRQRRNFSGSLETPNNGPITRLERASSAELTDHATLMSMPLTIVIFGATGDLARKKLFPSLYQLCARGLLPPDLARSAAARLSSTGFDYEYEIYRFEQARDEAMKRAKGNKPQRDNARASALAEEALVACCFGASGAERVSEEMLSLIHI